jgi:hypothetical protein
VAREPAGRPTLPDAKLERVEAGLARHVIVEVNERGACYLRGPTIADDQIADCSVTPKPSASPESPASRTSRTSSGPSSTRWTGTVTVQLPLLDAALDATNGVRPFQMCAFTATDDDKLGEPKDADLTAPADACETFNVSFVTEPLDDKILDGRLGGAPQQSTSDSSSTGSAGTTSDAGARRPTATLMANGQAAKSATQQNASVPALVGIAVLPFNEHARISFEAQDQDLLTSLGQTTTAALAKSIGSLDTSLSGSSGLAFDGSQSTSDDFGSIDSDVTQRVIAVPYRGFDPSAISKSDQRAFDSTDVLDLKPFDPKQILRLSYGTTVSAVDNDNGTIDLAYFRDGSQNESGGLLHGDKTLFFKPLDVSFGFTHTVANDLYASTGTSNAYLTQPDRSNPAFPTASDAPILHSANDVFALGVAFGPNGSDPGLPAVSRDFEFSTRYAENGIGHDATEVLSYQTDALNSRVGADGTTLVNSALIGLRDISYGYDPLLAPYDPFAGNRIDFARFATTHTRPGCTTKRLDEDMMCPIGKEGHAASSFAVSLVRADDGTQATYSGVGLVLSAAINPIFQIDVVHMRSDIAGSVEGRITGKAVVIDGTVAGVPVNAASNLLDNDASSLSLTAKIPKIISISAGLALANKPSCSGALTCSSSYSRSFTSNATINTGLFAFTESIAPGSIQGGQGATNLIASNHIVTNGVAAAHVCNRDRKHEFFGVEPSVTYSNAIPGTGSSFTPGSIVVERLDIGRGDGKGPGLIVSHTDASVAPGVTFALPTHSWSVLFTTGSQMLWKTTGNTGGDRCVPSDS